MLRDGNYGHDLPFANSTISVERGTIYRAFCNSSGITGDLPGSPPEALRNCRELPGIFIGKRDDLSSIL